MKVLTKGQIRSAEENAVASGIFSFKELMERAGNFAAEEIVNNYDIRGKRILVVCGRGNNGGDGIVIAKKLMSLGGDVSVFFPLGEVKSHPATEFKGELYGIKTAEDTEDNYYMVIDALFGIGFSGNLSDDAAELLNKLNSIDAVKVAVDVPSGIDSNGEFPPHTAFKADLTVTFIALKPCFLLPTTSSFSGKVSVIDIGVPVTDFSYSTIEKPKPLKRDKNSHKGTYGTAVFFCGSYGMAGAEILSVKASLVSGIGIARAVVCDKNYNALCTSAPEAVTFPVNTDIYGAPDVSDMDIAELLEDADSVLIGPGLGRSETAKNLIKRVLLKTTRPTVIDADGINAISADINILGKVKAPIILTPHPAEMARLCKTTVSDIEQNRISYSREFAKKFDCTVVLKGANTIVASNLGKVFFNTVGNAGMARGGSGDVLSGVITAYLGMGMNPLNAAIEGVYNHSLAGDMARDKYSERGMLPTDIIECLKTIT